MTSHQVLPQCHPQKERTLLPSLAPANWTYLLGFRKHEQGQNAVEIPKFEPLIAEWEARIAKLRDLKHQDPATVKEVQALLADKPHEHRDPNFKDAAPADLRRRRRFRGHALGRESAALQTDSDELGRPGPAVGRQFASVSADSPRPGAADAVIVLEDTNGDGKAETSTVFADGLLIPTGVLPDDQAVATSPRATNCCTSQTRTATARPT